VVSDAEPAPPHHVGRGAPTSERGHLPLADGAAPVRAPSFVVPYGCELPPPAATSPHPRRYLLGVLAVLPYKNLLLVIDALHLLRRRSRFDGDLVIIGVSHVSGAGYYHDVVTRRIRELGLEQHVHLLPPVPRERLATYYAFADCLVMPSIEESFGIPVIEAMWLGTPVAAARVHGEDRWKYFMPFDEICRDAAEYFDPFAPESCADAIERTLDRDRRAALTAAGRIRATSFSWRAAAQGTLTVFEAAVRT
jgi:glycosyltransferase involved in cell wall biosynthesis